MDAAKIDPEFRDNLKSITTKALSEEEKKDRSLDFLGGFEIIDNDCRMFVLEGLSNGAMKR